MLEGDGAKEYSKDIHKGLGKRLRHRKSSYRVLNPQQIGITLLDSAQLPNLTNNHRSQRKHKDIQRLAVDLRQLWLEKLGCISEDMVVHGGMVDTTVISHPKKRYKSVNAVGVQPQNCPAPKPDLSLIAEPTRATASGILVAERQLFVSAFRDYFDYRKRRDGGSETNDLSPGVAKKALSPQPIIPLLTNSRPPREKDLRDIQGVVDQALPEALTFSDPEIAVTYATISETTGRQSVQTDIIAMHSDLPEAYRSLLAA